MAVIRTTGACGGVHRGLQVLADVWRANRVPDYNPALGFFGSPWVGLEHFQRFFDSFQFERLIVNTLTVNSLGLLIAFPVPIILALVVNQLSGERFKKFTQTVLYSPSFISVVVVVARSTCCSPRGLGW